MKLTKTLLTLFISLIIISLGCKKTALDVQTINVKDVFNAAAAKEWYYGVFKKSAEWKTSTEAGKKLPIWKIGARYRKVGEMEIVEFPLTKTITVIPLYFMSKNSQEDKERVARASLNKIVFIKDRHGEIFVRELIIIPTHEFAKTSNYDLSSLELDKNFNFSGVIITKKWSGEILTNRKYENGKNIGKFIAKKVNVLQHNGNPSNAISCVTEEVCETHREDETCEVVSDQVVCTTGPLVTICSSYEICTNEDEDPECDYSSTESCQCQLYGIGCDGDEPDDPIDPPPGEDLGLDVNIIKNYTIKDQNEGYDIWQIEGAASLNGKKFTNPNLNFFTSCSAEGSVLWCTGLNPYCGDANGPLFVLFTQISMSSDLINSQQARALHQTQVVYPNYPSGVRTNYYNGTKLWSAATDL